MSDAAGAGPAEGACVFSVQDGKGRGSGFRSWWVCFGLAGLALFLRSYHLTGFVLDQDESHWLLYALQKNLLVEQWRNSYPRPDLLFPLVLAAPLSLFGPNELSLRILPVLFGTLSIFPLGILVGRFTGSDRAGFWAALLLAVLPLHVSFSAQGIPDTISLFFLLWALERLAWAVEEESRTDFSVFAGLLALSFLAKATSLYYLIFLLAMGFAFFRGQHQKRNFFIALAASILPFLAITLAIKWHGGLLTFFQEPVAVRDIHFRWSRIMTQIVWFTSFFHVALVAAVFGVCVALRQQRKLLYFLFPMVLLFVTPILRNNAKELLWLTPTVCLFAALGISSIRRVHFLWGGMVLVTLGGQLLSDFSVARIGFPMSLAGTGVAFLDRQPGWPSQQVTQWLLTHTLPNEKIMIVTRSYADSIVWALKGQRETFGAWENWEQLQDPTQRIKYVVFVGPHEEYAPLFSRYAQKQFFRIPEKEFVIYTLFDCQKDGRYVAYQDAFNRSESYLERGKRLLEQHQVGAAIGMLELACRLDSSLLSAKIALVPAYAAANRQEEALQIGLDILRVEPAQSQTNLNLALLYLELGKIPEGIAQCEKNIHLNIFSATSYGILGQLFEREGNAPRAQQAYERSLALDSKNPVTQRLLSEVRKKNLPDNMPR